MWHSAWQTKRGHNAAAAVVRGHITGTTPADTIGTDPAGIRRSRFFNIHFGTDGKKKINKKPGCVSSSGHVRRMGLGNARTKLERVV